MQIEYYNNDGVYTLFICIWLQFIIPVIKTLFLTIVLPGVFVTAHIECCHETETAIFAARTNLPVLDFQTWQVCVGYARRENDIVFLRIYITWTEIKKMWPIETHQL